MALTVPKSIVLGHRAYLSIPGQGSVNEELWTRFCAGADVHYAATNIRTQVNSIMRSTEQQKILYQQYQAGGVLAARPGTSKHEFGLAIDAQPVGRVADARWQAYFRPFGIDFPLDTAYRRKMGYRIEEWHAELAVIRAPLTPRPPLPTLPPEDQMNDVQMTQIKQHIEHVVLEVFERDVWPAIEARITDTIVREDADEDMLLGGVVKHLFPDGVNKPGKLDVINGKLDALLAALAKP